MSKYKVTIKVTETYTYDVDYARCPEDAMAQAFSNRQYWLCEYDNNEYNVTTKLQGLMGDE